MESREWRVASGVEWQRSCQKPNQVVHAPHAAAKSSAMEMKREQKLLLLLLFLLLLLLLPLVSPFAGVVCRLWFLFS